MHDTRGVSHPTRRHEWWTAPMASPTHRLTFIYFAEHAGSGDDSWAGPVNIEHATDALGISRAMMRATLIDLRDDGLIDDFRYVHDGCLIRWQS